MPPDIDPVAFFLRPEHPLQHLYEALRAYYVEDLTAEEVARRFDYSTQSIRVMASRFVHGKVGPFFRDIPRGFQHAPTADALHDAILELRAQGLSILDIADRLTAQGSKISYHTVWRVLRHEGVGRLPKRTAAQRVSPPKLPTEVADVGELDLSRELIVECRAPLLFLFAPFLASVDLPALVRNARYPGTSMIPSTSYVLSELALKLLHKPRKNHVMPIADDRGFGLFAGLNVLPKTTALSDYSYRMGPRPHRALLEGFVRARDRMDAYPSLSFNLDFHTIRHYGDLEKSALEKDYVPRRSQSVAAIVASFAQEAESREMVYSNANLLKREKSDEVLRFVDYWRRATGKTPEELVIDGRMTTHKGLASLDRRGITFITLRERRPNEVQRVMAVPEERWKRVELEIKDRKWRTPLVLDERVEILDYPGKIRQIAAMDLGREEPTLLLTNDVRRKPAKLLTRYARRTLIENSLSEQVHFFDMDALSSSVRLKVDMDVVLSVVASGCYHWLAGQLKGFETAKGRSIWDTFLDRSGKVHVTEEEIVLKVRRFSHAPVLLESSVSRDRTPVPWLGDRTVRLEVT